MTAANIHEEDGEHHTLGIARKVADEDGKHPDERAVHPFAGVGERAGHRIGCHEKRAEQEPPGEHMEYGVGEPGRGHDVHDRRGRDRAQDGGEGQPPVGDSRGDEEYPTEDDDETAGLAQ